MTPQQISGLSGQTIARRYQLNDLIGQGGFGAVIDGWDELADRRVAVKVIATDDLAQERAASSLAEVRREVAMLRMLRLPGVVRILDDGDDDRIGFIVMEFVEGEHFPTRGRRFAWDEIADTVRQLLLTLSRMHQAGFVHRDLKPENVLVDQDGKPVVVDLGLSIRPAQHRAGKQQAGKQPGLYGTPHFMAPELVRQARATPRSDLYSLGVMLHLALAGELPYPQKGFVELQRARFKTPVPRLDPDQVPAHLVDLVHGLLAIEPAERPPCAMSVLDGLQDAQAAWQQWHAHFPAPTEQSGQTEREESRLSVADLSGLFSGSERILRQKSKAAEALWNRSGGVPNNVTRIVEHWLDTGVAVRSGAKIAVPEDNLRTLLTSLEVPSVPPGDLEADGLSPGEVDLLGTICLMWPNSRMTTLSAVLRCPAWIVEVSVDVLMDAGLVRLDDEGRVWPAVQPRTEALTQEKEIDRQEEEREAHRRAVSLLKPGTPGRLMHLLRGDGEPEAIAEEVLAICAACLAEGRLQQCVASVRSALSLLRGTDFSELRSQVYARWADAAIALNTPCALDEICYALAQEDSHPDVAVLDQLCKAVLEARRTGGQSSLEALDAIEPLDDPRLERWRQAFRVRATWTLSVDDERRVLEEAAAWGEDHALPIVRSSIKAWRARLAYREGRFQQAAAQHLEAAAEQSGTAQLASLLNGASAQLEAFLHEDAQATAGRARGLAWSMRLSHHAAKAHYLIRSSQYRRGLPLEVDREFIAVVRSLDVQYLEGLVLLNEAAIAWRNEDPDAAQLAMESHNAMRGVGLDAVSRLPLALHHVASGELLETAQALALMKGTTGEGAGGSDEDTSEAPPRIVCQIVGLLAMATRHREHVYESQIEKLIGSVPFEQRDKRLEVLSMSEILNAVTQN